MSTQKKPATINYMLDTNICIYIMKNHPPEIKEILNDCPIGSVSISSIVLAELNFGISKSQHKEKNEVALKDFLKYCDVKDWPYQAAGIYGEIRTELQSKGNIIGGNDLLIATHAVYEKATLISNNIKEFDRVTNLELENWLS